MDSLMIFVVLGYLVLTISASAIIKNNVKKDIISTVDVPKPTKAPYFWCDSEKCASTEHCDSVVRESWLCCPTCGCTNQMAVKMEVGQIFRLQEPGKSCYLCKCEARYFWEDPFADCMEVKCPAVPISCTKTYLPAGSCCKICADDTSSTDGGLQKAFPKIPESMMDLKK